MRFFSILNLFIILISLFFGSCNSKDIVKLKDGLIIYPQDSKVGAIKIEIINPDIVHVIASKDKEIYKDSSLAVLEKNKDFKKWKYKLKDNLVLLFTDNLIIEVNKINGEIIFKDRQGNIKLSEPENSKIFVPIKANDGSSWYSVIQEFNSDNDEALYGLGQHQNRQMNYKGEDVELIQHNIVAVNPFLYSSKNYGILWDNYSITRFGDHRQYKPISDLILFNEKGKKGGLTAKYYYKGKLSLERDEDTIDYQFIETINRWPKNIPSENVKVIWAGYISSEVSGRHKFRLYASDYVKLWIDDSLIIDKWRQNWNPWYNKFYVDLKKGEKRSIKIEWLRNGGYLGLEHLDPLPTEKQEMIRFSSEYAKNINYYFINGNNADEVISGYRKLTGKAPIFPIWAYGFWQSRERYKTQEELLDVVRKFKELKIPIDNIVLDWRYWCDSAWGSHEFDKSRFPSPSEMIETLHTDLKTRIMISVWPKFYEGIEHFNEMKEKGFLYMRNIELKRKDWVGYVSTFYDAFNPEARKLFWKQVDEHLNSLGFDAWWLDATEPDMESNHNLEERARMMNPTYLGPGEVFFNGYSLVHSHGFYEGLRTKDPNKRVFILTRSAFAGQQRYSAATWSGDVASRWSDLADQIPAGLNFCIAGIPYWTHDIGGFAVEQRFEKPSKEDLEEWRELNTRWYQFGAFCPIFRVHGQFPYREIFNIAPNNHPAYISMLYYNKLRYKLIPYIYSLAGLVYLYDYTMMRPLIMDFINDENIRNIHDQYMFGPTLMVCPVTKYKARNREVYLPKGQGWFDLYTGKYYEGGRNYTVDAPYEKIPVFAKEGSMLLMYKEIQNTSEYLFDTIKVIIFGEKNASFKFYIDDGLTNNYERGDYNLIEINYESAQKTLTLKQLDKNKLIKEKIYFEIFRISKDNPIGIDDIKNPLKTIQLSKQEVKEKI